MDVEPTREPTREPSTRGRSDRESDRGLHVLGRVSPWTLRDAEDAEQRGATRRTAQQAKHGAKGGSPPLDVAAHTGWRESKDGSAITNFACLSK